MQRRSIISPATLRRRWADLPVRAKGLVVLAMPLTMLVLASGIFFVTMTNTVAAQRSVIHARITQDQIALVRGLVLEEEAAARGYLLTDDPALMGHATRAERQLRAAVDRLAALVADEPAQSSRAARLRSLLAERPRVPDVRAPDRGAREGWLSRQQASTAAVRTELALLSDTEAQLLENLLAQRGFWQRWASWGVGGALAVGFLGGLVAMGALTTGVARRLERLKWDAQLIDAGEEVGAADEAGDELGVLSRRLHGTVDLLRARERELTEARAFLEKLLTAGPAVVLRWEEPGQVITYVSPNCTRVLGVSPETVSDTAWWQGVLTEGDQMQLRAAVDDLTSGTAATRTVEVCAEIDGRARYMTITLTVESGPEPPDSGPGADSGAAEATALLAYVTDVTERRSAENALAERERRLRAITAASPDIITALDPDLRVTWVSPTVEAVLGYRPDERIGRSELDLVSSADREAVSEAIRAIAAGKKAQVTMRYGVRDADGHLLPVEARGRPLRDTVAGHPSGVLLVVRDISMQLALEEESQMAREEAEGANRAKSEFLSRMSHELRTPLNAVLGFAQLLEMELREDQQESVRQILRAGRHLLDLINEVLDIARIETGRLTLSPEPVLVTELIDEAVDLMGPLAQAQDVAIDRDAGPESRRYVRADRQRIKQVVLNLLSNAVKYNRAGGNVRVRCAVADDARLQISVQDTGIGIPPADLPRLFTPFDRLSAASSDIEGTGVGLALTQRLINAMDGTIAVQSQIGHGSTFTITLPLTDAPTAPAAPRVAPNAPEAQASHHPGGTVLYIEDNQSNLQLLEGILRRRPAWRLVPAAQGSLGLDLAAATNPDLVLLDLHLPDMPGIDVLRHLRADPVTAATRIVVISADATPGQVARLRAAGADMYLSKPIDVEQLLRLLDKVATERHGGDGG
jgi:PAS domain S-box-containing protein